MRPRREVFGYLVAGALVAALLVMITRNSATTVTRLDAAAFDDSLEQSLQQFAADIQQSFAHAIANEGVPYREARLHLVEGDVVTGCGRTEGLIGFYCESELAVYLDVSFYRALRERYGARGDRAQAYILAHELGHHVQQLLGAHARLEAAVAGDPSRAPELTMRLELQADCYAGIWARETSRHELSDIADLDATLAAAAQVGAERAGQSISRALPAADDASHARERWFRVGFDEGTIGACDTVPRQAAGD